MCIFSIKTISISIAKSIERKRCKVFKIVSLHRFEAVRFRITRGRSLGTFHSYALTFVRAQQGKNEVSPPLS